MRMGGSTYRAAELVATVRALADYTEGSLVALSVGADLELTTLLSRHDGRGRGESLG